MLTAFLLTNTSTTSLTSRSLGARRRAGALTSALFHRVARLLGVLLSRLLALGRLVEFLGMVRLGAADRLAWL
jgi:hypothetical protein